MFPNTFKKDDTISVVIGMSRVRTLMEEVQDLIL